MSKKHKPHCYEYPHPSVTVDCLIFALSRNDLKILLVRRKGQPYRGCWALPGGFVEIDEGVDAAALRELQEETGVEDLFLEQLHTFGEPKRDPRERVISVAYYSLIRQKEHTLQAGSDASDTQWFPVRRLPKLAFDHDEIIAMALERLQCRVRSAPVIFELLPHKFRMDELQRAYETILRRKLNTKRFRRDLESNKALAAAKGAERLHQVDRKRFQKMLDKGSALEINAVSRGRKK